MHYDPSKQGKLVLSEAQFNFVRNVYSGTNRNLWNMSDEQQVKQTFINIYNVYEKVYMAKQRKK